MLVYFPNWSYHADKQGKNKKSSPTEFFIVLRVLLLHLLALWVGQWLVSFDWKCSGKRLAESEKATRLCDPAVLEKHKGREATASASCCTESEGHQPGKGDGDLPLSHLEWSLFFPISTWMTRQTGVKLSLVTDPSSPNPVLCLFVLEFIFSRWHYTLISDSCYVFPLPPPLPSFFSVILGFGRI